MKINKKGISPLIATILLVVVAVVLIAIVLSWGKSFTTDSLAQTSNVIDNSCTGASLSLTDCSINSDGNLVFYVRNTSSSYSIASSDNLVVDLMDSEGTFDAGVEIPFTSWDGLSPGETVQAIVPTTNVDENAMINVTVKSSVCPNDAVSTYNNCHK